MITSLRNHSLGRQNYRWYTGIKNIFQPPGTIISDLHAQVDVPGSQLGSYAIVDVTVQVEYTLFQGDDRAVREDQRPS